MQNPSLPDATDCCAILSSDAQPICNPDGTLSYTPTIINNSGNPIQYIYLYPPTGVTMTPDHFTMPTGGLPNNQPFTPTSPVIITGASAARWDRNYVSALVFILKEWKIAARARVFVSPCSHVGHRIPQRKTRSHKSATDGGPPSRTYLCNSIRSRSTPTMFGIGRFLTSTLGIGC